MRACVTDTIDDRFDRTAFSAAPIWRKLGSAVYLRISTKLAEAYCRQPTGTEASFLTGIREANALGFRAELDCPATITPSGSTLLTSNVVSLAEWKRRKLKPTLVWYPIRDEKGWKIEGRWELIGTLTAIEDKIKECGA